MVENGPASVRSSGGRENGTEDENVKIDTCGVTHDG